jgi:predicted nucleic acid-binding protein
MALILDTNALSAFADGDSKLHRTLSHADTLAIPVVVLGEYLYGIRGSRFKSRYEAWLSQHLHLFTLLRIGSETAIHYAEIRAELRALGRPIPSNDLWIAALVREYGFTLVTRDLHFRFVRRLALTDW